MIATPQFDLSGPLLKGMRNGFTILWRTCWPYILGILALVIVYRIAMRTLNRRRQ